MQWGRRIVGWVWVASVAASTLLFVAAMGMWGKFSDEWMEVGWKTNDATPRYMYAVSFHSGQSVILMTQVREGVDIGWVQDGWYHASIDMPRSWLPKRSSTLAFWFHIDLDRRQALRTWAVTIPHWFIALLCLPLPLIAIGRWRKNRRIEREGLCQVCGYDLRASVERCPECGTTIEVKHAIT